MYYLNSFMKIYARENGHTSYLYEPFIHTYSHNVEIFGILRRMLTQPRRADVKIAVENFKHVTNTCLLQTKRI